MGALLTMQPFLRFSRNDSASIIIPWSTIHNHLGPNMASKWVYFIVGAHSEMKIIIIDLWSRHKDHIDFIAVGMMSGYAETFIRRSKMILHRRCRFERGFSFWSWQTFSYLFELQSWRDLVSEIDILTYLTYVPVALFIVALVE